MATAIAITWFALGEHRGRLRVDVTGDAAVAEHAFAPAISALCDVLRGQWPVTSTYDSSAASHEYL